MTSHLVRIQPIGLKSGRYRVQTAEHWARSILKHLLSGNSSMSLSGRFSTHCRLALSLAMMLALSACGMTDSRLDVLPPTPLPMPPPDLQIVDVDAVSMRLIELSGGTLPATAEPPETGMVTFDEELAQSLALSLEREGLTVAARNPAPKESWEKLREPEVSAPPIPPVQNVSALGESNYTQYFQNHVPLSSRLLQFASDSLTVTAANRRYLRQIAREFSSDTDLVSVLGCSNGPTRLRNGNALLALGRAQGVQQQLLVSGVPPNLILSEGCWSGQRRTDNLPNRGVLVTVFRQAPSES